MKNRGLLSWLIKKRKHDSQNNFDGTPYSLCAITVLLSYSYFRMRIRARDIKIMRKSKYQGHSQYIILPVSLPSLFSSVLTGQYKVYYSLRVTLFTNLLRLFVAQIMDHVKKCMEKISDSIAFWALHQNIDVSGSHLINFLSTCIIAIQTSIMIGYCIKF